MMKNKMNQYRDEYDHGSFDDQVNIGKDVIAYAAENDIPIEKDEDTVKHLIDTDIRENIPPQMYQVICNIVEMIEDLEK